MAKSTEPFKIAIKASLYALVANGDKINAAQVIANAKFEGGTPVGQNTLYKKKSDGSGERIHEDLIQMIAQAKDGKLKEDGKPSRGETIKSLSGAIVELNQQLKVISDQVIEQEERHRNTEVISQSNRGNAKNYEEDLYILYSIIALTSPRGSLINDRANEFIQKYELKSVQTTITRAKGEVNEYISDMKDSTLYIIK